jgi:hypothetical protein
MKPVGYFTNFLFDFISKIQHHPMYILAVTHETLELSESGNSADSVALLILYLEF